ncbi:MAG TPA: tetratricopeptide repeat protein [Gemmatimonadales bacterium]|nr:tetratricopeptide repeat protein [Gemmatimonadales bacterium]
MSKLEKLKERARALEAKDTKAAIDSWLEVLDAQEDESDPNPDLAIFNRIGDLYLKLKDPGQAADYYDRAVDRYAELGFHNNAIAMCNKVLRNAPGRPSTYLKLAKLYAAKGFTGEARQNFIEYAERMQKAGNIQQAFQALKEFVDLSPEGEQLRQMLEEHLRAHGGPELQAKLAAAPAPKPGAAPPTAPKVPKRKTTSLVFLDLDEPAKAKTPLPGRPSGGPVRPTMAPPVSAPPVAKAPPPPPPAPPPVARPAAGALETTSMGDDVVSEPVDHLDGLQITNTDFDQVRESVRDVESLRQENLVGDAEPIEGLEPTAPAAEEQEAPEPIDLPLVEAFEVGVPDSEIEEEPSLPAQELVVPPLVEPSKRKTIVEIPPLELESSFDDGMETATAAQHHDVDDEPLAIDDSIDVIKESDREPLVFSGLGEAAVEAPSIEELEARVADDPDDAEAHQALGEGLIEAGERNRGVEELELASAGFENAGNLIQAQGLVDEILRLDPNSVRHRQKQVEFAYKAGDKARLIEAYLELADTLLRTDLADKARAVYERVVEHDPKNERARAALSMLAPPPEPPKQEGRVAPKDAKMRVRDETSEVGDFVDLGAMILDEDAPRDTRMKVEDEAPTGDEEQDFREMLTRFRQGIDENIEDTDFQSHYDLGVAFKEMGLLDEAISEFQKALRAPEGKLRTSEALGVCFFEKGASVVAESILRRALELPSTGDQERLGILYWLARAIEEQGKAAEARELYGRVFAVDIRFMDVGARVKALANAR